jgi:hypothetical protein
MTIIKNHFEVFLVTSKKQGNGIIESKVDFLDDICLTEGKLYWKFLKIISIYTCFS